MSKYYSARADYKKWFTRDYWDVWETACITCGLDPEIIKKGSKGELDLDCYKEFKANELGHPKRLDELIKYRVQQLKGDLSTL